MAPQKPILSLHSLDIGYNSTLISDINLEIGEGEIVSILGPSGIGKTTLLRTIAGSIRSLNGDLDLNIPRRGGLGYIPQRLGLVRHMDVQHNVKLGARAGAPWNRSRFSEVKKRTMDAISTLGLKDKINEPIRRLSGGQQRRVATARTLAQQPKLILADEFLSELDTENVGIVLDAIQSLVKDGTSLLMVEHHEKRAREISDRILRVKDGRIIEEAIK